MTETAPLLSVPLPVDAAMLAALHRRACVVCGAMGGPLMDAGYVYTTATEGARLGWPVASCPSHPEKADAR